MTSVMRPQKRTAFNPTPKNRNHKMKHSFTLIELLS